MPTHHTENLHQPRRRGTPSSLAAPQANRAPISSDRDLLASEFKLLKARSLSPQSAWVFVLAGLVLVILLERGNLPFLSHPLRYYLVVPLVWVGIATASLWGWYRGLEEKPGLDALVIQLAVVVGFLDLAAAITVSLIWGIGSSPYSRQLIPFLGNLFHVTALLIGLETARAYLLWRWYPRSPVWAFGAITILFALLMTPSGASIRTDSFASLLYTTGITILPNLSSSLLLTYLVWIGGPWAAILYRYFPLTFEWFSPVLPDLNQLESAFLRTLVPIGILLFLNQVVNRQEEDSEEKNRSSSRWMYVALICAGLLWLNTGSLGIRTFLVSGVSMEPYLQAGDVVIVGRSSPEDIHVGDVILFQNQSRQVVHRVIEVQETRGGLEFVTQGDANNRPDDPVAVEDVAGKAIVRIPKIGWLSLQLKRIVGWLN